MNTPFSSTPAPPIRTAVRVEPVYTALLAFWLLNRAPGGPRLDPWAEQTARALDPDQRHANRLVFGPLVEALPLQGRWPDFTAYLQHLAALDPLSLRDRLLIQLCRQPSGIPRDEPMADPAALLADPTLFVALRARRAADQPTDDSLLREAHVLLNHPPALHDLLVTHLQRLWHERLAVDWQRRLPWLRSMSALLDAQPLARATALETVELFLAREVPAPLRAQLDGARSAIFVLFPYGGPYAATFDHPDTVWVFAPARSDDVSLLRRTPPGRRDVLEPLAAIADESRLHILELLAQRERHAQDLIDALGQSQPNVSRHLKTLNSAGLIVERRAIEESAARGASGGGPPPRSYRLDPAGLDRLFWQVRRLLLDTDPRAEVPEAMVQPPGELGRFLDGAARLVSFPTRRRDQVLALRYLAAHFVSGHEYGEREVNRLLNRWHTFADPAMLRRALFDGGLLDRSPDGARYWRTAQA